MKDNFSVIIEYDNKTNILYIDSCKYFNIHTKQDVLNVFNEYFDNYISTGDNNNGK